MGATFESIVLGRHSGMADVLLGKGHAAEHVMDFLRIHGEGLPAPLGSLNERASERMFDQRFTSIIIALPRGRRHVTEMIGHVSLHYRQEWCGLFGYASLLAVDPEYRRQGVAQELMFHLRAVAEDARCRYIECECAPDREFARHILAKDRWQLVEGSDRHFRRSTVGGI